MPAVEVKRLWALDYEKNIVVEGNWYKTTSLSLDYEGRAWGNEALNSVRGLGVNVFETKQEAVDYAHGKLVAAALEAVKRLRQFEINENVPVAYLDVELTVTK